MATASVVHAQLMDEFEFRREGANAVVQIHFAGVVQFQRALTSRSGDLVQAFYSVVVSAESNLTVAGERRISTGRGLPEFVVTDEAISRETVDRRKLLIRFNEPSKVKVRAGKTRDSLELVFEGLGPALDLTDNPKSKAFEKVRFAVTLQSDLVRGEALKGSIPSGFQDAEVFTSQRVVNGATQYDINLGYFDSLAAANSAAAQLKARFPNASAFQIRPPIPSLESAATPSAVAESTSLVAPASAEVERQAQDLYAQGLAAMDRADYQDAIAALDKITDCP